MERKIITAQNFYEILQNREKTIKSEVISFAPTVNKILPPRTIDDYEVLEDVVIETIGNLYVSTTFCNCVFKGKFTLKGAEDIISENLTFIDCEFESEVKLVTKSTLEITGGKSFDRLSINTTKSIKIDSITSCSTLNIHSEGERIEILNLLNENKKNRLILSGVNKALIIEHSFFDTISLSNYEVTR